MCHANVCKIIPDLAGCVKRDIPLSSRMMAPLASTYPPAFGSRGSKSTEHCAGMAADCWPAVITREGLGSGTCTVFVQFWRLTVQLAAGGRQKAASPPGRCSCAETEAPSITNEPVTLTEWGIHNAWTRHAMAARQQFGVHSSLPLPLFMY